MDADWRLLQADLMNGELLSRCVENYSGQLQEALGLGRRATGRFGEDLGQIEGLAEQAERDLGRRVEDATGTLRGGVTTLEQQLDKGLGARADCNRILAVILLVLWQSEDVPSLDYSRALAGLSRHCALQLAG